MSEKIESEELEALLGKRVRITFEDWDEREGILGKPNFLRG